MVEQGILYSVAERKLEGYKKKNPDFVEVIRITPGYYSRSQITIIPKLIFAISLIIVGTVFVVTLYVSISNPDAPILWKIIGSGTIVILIIGVIIYLSIVFHDFILYPNMLQALLINKERLVKWNCLFGMTWVRSFDLNGLEYFVKKVQIDIRDGDGDFVIEMYYGKDEFGRERVKKLWLEKPMNKNIIEVVANALKKAGFEVKEPLASKFLGKMATFG